jgi:hypothetical protein
VIQTKEFQMKKITKHFEIAKVLILALVAVICFSLADCKQDEEKILFKGGNNTQDNAVLVTVGYSSSFTISQSGQHWFKFAGTDEPVIFETRGDVVDTQMYIWIGDNFLSSYGDDNSGEGYNALCGINPTTSGTTYFIRIETQNSTSGTYTFTVTVPTVNIRTNPIPVTVGYSSSRTIHSNGQHWFSFQGTDNSVVFETTGNVVRTSINFFIGENTSAVLTDNTRISFNTLLGTTYYIRITGNSGTYTFNVRNGTGDGTSQTYATPVTAGYSSSHTISQSGQHWFSFTGTGSTVIFETEGNVVDTQMYIWIGNNFLSSYGDDNSGEGYNASISVNPTTLGTPYFILIETQNSTSGTYTFVVR